MKLSRRMLRSLINETLLLKNHPQLKALKKQIDTIQDLYYGHSLEFQDDAIAMAKQLADEMPEIPPEYFYIKDPMELIHYFAKQHVKDEFGDDTAENIAQLYSQDSSVLRGYKGNPVARSEGPYAKQAVTLSKDLGINPDRFPRVPIPSLDMDEDKNPVGTDVLKKLGLYHKILDHARDDGDMKISDIIYNKHLGAHIKLTFTIEVPDGSGDYEYQYPSFIIDLFETKDNEINFDAFEISSLDYDFQKSYDTSKDDWEDAFDRDMFEFIKDNFYPYY